MSDVQDTAPEATPMMVDDFIIRVQEGQARLLEGFKAHAEATQEGATLPLPAWEDLFKQFLEENGRDEEDELDFDDDGDFDVEEDDFEEEDDDD